MPRIDERLEALAALEHEQWAHWTRYMLTVLEPMLRGELLTTAHREGPRFINSEAEAAYQNVKRWQCQIKTPYDQLSDAEKESDREWARKVLAVLSEDDAVG